MTITINAAVLGSNISNFERKDLSDPSLFKNILIPGETISINASNLITGHGTYRSDSLRKISDSAVQLESLPKLKVDECGNDESSSTLPMNASLAGHLKSVNKLMYVEPPNARYAGNVGDTIVGRIVEVKERQWKVDVNSYQLANLSLANVKLPTGELRRKSEDDERAMRSFMREGDLIVAEVREIYRDGSLQLHMPGKRTGRLGEGCLIRLSSSLVRRQKMHRHNLAIPRGYGCDHNPENDSLPATVSIGLILGCNGFIWIGPSRGMDLGLCLGVSICPAGSVIGTSNSELLAERIATSRVRNVILSLAGEGISIWETSVIAGCEASWLDEYHQTEGEAVYELMSTSDMENSRHITRLLRPEHRKHLASLVVAKLGLL